MPTPRENESRDDFVSRCIPIVLDDGAAEDQDQAIAVCNSMWEEAQSKVNWTRAEVVGGSNMERKTFHGFVTKADEEQGIVEAYFAVFGNIDQGNDIIHPGAFTKTFLERGGKVRVLDNHRTDTIERAIGKPLLLKEVGRDELPEALLTQNPEATGGAFARVQMLMDTPEGKGAFIRLRDGAIDEWSFGYDALDHDFSRAMKDGEEVNVRNLRTLKLYEISPVLFAMNEATTTVSAKAEDDDLAPPQDEAGDDDFENKVLQVLEKHGYAPVEQAATDNQNDKQAGPDTPPTSNVLDEIQLLKVQTETLEVSYEEQGVAGEKQGSPG